MYVVLDEDRLVLRNDKAAAVYRACGFLQSFEDEHSFKYTSKKYYLIAFFNPTESHIFSIFDKLPRS